MKETVVTSAPRGITKQFLSATLLFHDFQENQETLEDMISLMTREGGTKEDVQKIMKDVQTEQKKLRSIRKEDVQTIEHDSQCKMCCSYCANNWENK